MSMWRTPHLRTHSFMVDFTGEYHPVFLNIRCDSAVTVYTDGVSVLSAGDGMKVLALLEYSTIDT